MVRFILVLMLAAWPLATAAQSERDIRTQAQASMLVTGTVDIELNGTVSAFALDDQSKLPPYVVNVVDKAVPAWRFEPIFVDGIAVPARSRMTLRLVAAPAGDDGIEVSINSASFGAYDEGDTGSVRAVSRAAPRYPFTARRLWASSDVYLVVKIAPEGHVVDVAVEQVNLRSSATGSTMERLRKLFSEAAIAAARTWIFSPPSTGDQADAPYWSMAMPVSFVMDEDYPDDGYGHWIGYIPGPRQTAPWLQEADWSANDALADGTMRQIGTGPRLLTALQPES